MTFYVLGVSQLCDMGVSQLWHGGVTIVTYQCQSRNSSIAKWWLAVYVYEYNCEEKNQIPSLSMLKLAWIENGILGVSQFADKKVTLPLAAEWPALNI